MKRSCFKSGFCTKTGVKKDVINKIIPEFISGSSTQAVIKQQALKTLKRVQGLFNFTTAKAAFTLIELLVVVLIIGILAAVAVPQYQRAVLKARAVQLFTLARHFKDVCTVDLLAGGTCAKLQDIGFEYEIADYTYDESSDLEAGTVNGFPIEHRTSSFSAYDTQSDLSVYVTAQKNGIYCIANNHAPDIEKVCESMGGQKDPFYNTNANTFYRL